MKHHLPILLLITCAISACSTSIVDEFPPLSSDNNGVTVPVNIAPIRFALEDSLRAKICSVEYSFEGECQASAAKLSIKKWRKLLNKARGSSIEITITAKVKHKRIQYKPFPIYVSEDPIDPYLVYRLIEPGYELWNEMGIYQRNLENYSQKPVIENKMTDYGCVNCHSFSSFNPEKYLFHARMACAGTYIINGDNIEKLNTKTPETISALVYPQWHPSGKYVIFSVNNTKQRFHISNQNRIEVFDYSSDVVVYDIERHEVFSCPQLKAPGKFETFPTFSPDGDRIYYCCADSLSMPQGYNQVRYSLLSVGFDPDTRRFGESADLLYDATEESAGSVSFPRVSPDGRYLMYTLSEYGNFSIWHKDADLFLMNLQTREQRNIQELNSDDVESYHSWSSNSRWVVFSSRRDDKLYTKLYVSHIDDKGSFSKPLLLPQASPDYYAGFMKSYNLPEFVTGPVRNRAFEISSIARADEGTDISFSSINF